MQHETGKSEERAGKAGRGLLHLRQPAPLEVYHIAATLREVTRGQVKRPVRIANLPKRNNRAMIASMARIKAR